MEWIRFHCTEVAGSGRISGNRLGKRWRGRLKPSVFPCRGRRLETQYRSEKDFKIRKKCAGPRILQRDFQFDRQDFCNVVLLDGIFEKQQFFMAEAERCQVRNSGRPLQQLSIFVGKNIDKFFHLRPHAHNCISPFKTFTSCGSSSNLYFRRKRPTRVTRASRGAVRKLPSAQPVNMLLNLRRRNFRRPLPTRY